MKAVVAIVATALLSSVCHAQAGTTIKQGAKASGEKAKEYGDRGKAAVSSQPTKAGSQAKARAHKAASHEHAHAAKQAAREIPK